MNTQFNPMIEGKSDRGKVRENNEDKYDIIDEASNEQNTDLLGILLVVADGMGGHIAGETASRLACEELIQHYYNLDTDDSKALLADDLHDRLVEAVNRSNATVLAHAMENPELDGMGTTLTAMVLLPEEALIAHVGDSRIYRLRGELMEKLTVDHTEVQALLDMGRLRPEKAATHPRRHILTQAIGVEPVIEEVFVKKEPLLPGDIFLLCSDGLFDIVPEERIRQILMDNPAPLDSCDRLVDAALDAGGKDNITVVVARIL